VTVPRSSAVRTEQKVTVCVMRWPSKEAFQSFKWLRAHATGCTDAADFVWSCHAAYWQRRAWRTCLLGQ